MSQGDTAPDILEAWQAIADVMGKVEGVKVVMGANDGTASEPVVVPLSEELVDFPAIVLVPGPWENIAGGASRFTIQWLGSMYVPRPAPGDGSTALLGLFRRLLEVMATHAKPSTDGSLQFVLITEGPGLSSEKWPNTETGADYLTWPFELEAKFNQNALAYRANP